MDMIVVAVHISFISVVIIRIRISIGIAVASMVPRIRIVATHDEKEKSRLLAIAKEKCWLVLEDINLTTESRPLATKV